MEESALGLVIRKLRENRKLTLRELGSLSGVDHTYIFRLEAGANKAPSDDVLTKLIKTLKPLKRESEILGYVASHGNTDPALVEFSLADESVTLQEIAMAAGAVYRGPARPDYPRLLQTIRRIMAEDDSA